MGLRLQKNSQRINGCKAMKYSFVYLVLLSLVFWGCKDPLDEDIGLHYPPPVTTEEDSVAQDTFNIERQRCPLPACGFGCFDTASNWFFMEDSCRISDLPNCNSSQTVAIVFDDVLHELIGIHPDDPMQVLVMEIRKPRVGGTTFHVILFDMCTGNKFELPPSLQGYSQYTLGASDWVAFKHTTKGVCKAKINGDSLQLVSTTMLGRANDSIARTQDSNLLFSSDGKKLLFLASGYGYVLLNEQGAVIDTFNRIFGPQGWAIDDSKIFLNYLGSDGNMQLGYLDVSSKLITNIPIQNQAIEGTTVGPGPKPHLMIWEKAEQIGEPFDLMMMDLNTGESTRIRQGYYGMGQALPWHSARDGSYFCNTVLHYKEYTAECVWKHDSYPHFFAPDCTCEIIADFD